MGTFAAGHMLDPHTGRPVAAQVITVLEYPTDLPVTPDGGPIATGARGGYGRFAVPDVDTVTLEASDGTRVDLVSIEAQEAAAAAGPFLESAERRLSDLESRSGTYETLSTSTNLNDLSAHGTYVIPDAVAAGRMTNIPTQWAGVLKVHGEGEIRSQTYTPTRTGTTLANGANLPPMYLRRTNQEGGWSPWVALATGQRVLAQADLNNTTSPGVHVQEFGSNSTPARNYPVATRGVLSVADAGNGRVHQTFTSMDGRIFVRELESGTWAPWTPVNRGTPIHTGSLDTYGTPATYPVGSLSVTGRPPVEETGTLIVGHGGWDGNGQTQLFLTVGNPPKMFLRRRTSPTATWGDWTQFAGATETAKIAALEARTRTTVVRALSAPTVNVNTGKHSSIVPMSMSRDRRTLYATGVPFLRESHDFGHTWTTPAPGQPGHLGGGESVESVTQMENGELIIVARQTSGLRRFWVTTGYGTPDMTVQVTFTARNPMIYFPQEWATSFDGRVLVAAEYGPKHPSWMGDPVTAETAARYAWISLDYGHTWTNVFDLIPFLSDKMSLPNYYFDIHLHGAAWDPYWDRIWLTFGDSRDGIVYSDDLGVTWKWAAFTNVSVGSDFQSVGIIPMPNCVLFASDNTTYAQVRRIDRSEGRGKEGHYILHLAWRDTVESGMFCRGKSRAHRLRDDAPALFIWSADTSAAATVAVATLDGYTFQPLWRDTDQVSAGLGGRSILGPTLNGQILGTIVGHPDGWRVIEMPATGY